MAMGRANVRQVGVVILAMVGVVVVKWEADSVILFCFL